MKGTSRCQQLKGTSRCQQLKGTSRCQHFKLAKSQITENGFVYSELVNLILAVMFSSIHIVILQNIISQHKIRRYQKPVYHHLGLHSPTFKRNAECVIHTSHCRNVSPIDFGFFNFYVHILIVL